MHFGKDADEHDNLEKKQNKKENTKSQVSVQVLNSVRKI